MSFEAIVLLLLLGVQVKARLAGTTGRLSARMGTALRHAGSLLGRRPSDRKPETLPALYLSMTRRARPASEAR